MRCYDCAIHPSIMALSSLLSHHSVTFTVALSRCRLHVSRGFVVAITVSPLSSHCCSAFAVASSQFHHRHCGFVITVVVLLSPSWCRLHHRIVMVLLLLSWCHLCICHGFVVAIMVLPSHKSWFCVHHRGVAFMLVVVSLLPLWCRLCHRIVVVSSSQLRCCGAFAVASLWFHRHHCGVAFIIALSQCSLPFHHCRHGVAFIIASSRFCHCCFVVVVLLLLFCCCCFIVAFTVASSRFCCCLVVSSLQSCHCVVVVMVVVMVVVVVVVVALWLWLLLCYGHHRGCCIIVVLSWSSWSWLWSCRSHCCVVSTKSRLSRRPSVFWPGVESQNTTIRRIIGIIECDIPPLVIFIVTLSHRRHVIVIAVIVSSLS